ncbi:MAG: DUF2523 family protein [Azonexus sp.]|jgi:hypothetical protein|nr:DUF2523 family protein [Azonexus sp.]
MALPLLAATALGSIVGGLTQFFASRAGLILAGLGLTFIGVKGFEVLLGTFIQDISTITSGLQAAGGALPGGGSLGPIMLQYAAHAGLFDALNICFSAYSTMISFVAVRFILGRLNG